MKLVSIVTPTYNEQENVRLVYQQVKNVFARLKKYRYELIFIDNASKDRTVPILKSIAKRDKNVKIIVNARNFGWIRSPYHAILQAKGDAVVLLVADLQDPPSLIATFIAKWEKGYKVVIGVRSKSEKRSHMSILRTAYYRLVKNIAEEVELTTNFSGFGLYDRKVVDVIRDIADPYPYFRGLVAEIGFDTATVEYTQVARKGGITSSNFFKLFDVAILGITSYSRVPLRLITMLGFMLSSLSLSVAVVYFVYKLIVWQWFNAGIAPLVIGLFFFASVQLFFIGIIGEYIGIIHTRILKRPLVIEKERINFD